MDLTIPRVLMWQFLVGAVLAAALWGVFGNVAGYSALLGSLICVIPNAFLALRLVVPRRDPGAGALIRAAYIGELGKPMAPAVWDLILPIAKRLRDRGIATGTLVFDPAFARTLIEEGFTFVACGSDAGLLARGADSLLKQVRGD